jgi:hypothetical protein
MRASQLKSPKQVTDNNNFAKIFSPLKFQSIMSHIPSTYDNELEARISFILLIVNSYALFRGQLIGVYAIILIYYARSILL